MVTIANFEESDPAGGRAVKLRHAARERGGSGPRRANASCRASLASINDRIPTELLDQNIRAMTEQSGSGVRMCHEQGKTAAHLSDDGRSIVEHEPHGVVRHLPLDTDSRSGK